MEELFRDGDWRLVNRNDGTNKASVQHRCQEGLSGGRLSDWWYYTNGTQCFTCDKPIPDAIMGLKALHNWDR